MEEKEKKACGGITDLVGLHQDLLILFIWVECAFLIWFGHYVIKNPIPIVVGIGYFILVEVILLLQWMEERHQMK